MSTWVDLGDLYVKKAGDEVSGSILMANNNLSVAYDSDTTYNVGTEIKTLRDSVSQIQSVKFASGSWVGTLGNNSYWDFMSFSSAGSYLGIGSFNVNTCQFFVANGEAGALQLCLVPEVDNARKMLRVRAATGVLPTGSVRLNWMLIYNPKSVF